MLKVGGGRAHEGACLQTPHPSFGVGGWVVDFLSYGGRRNPGLGGNGGSQGQAAAEW